MKVKETKYNIGDKIWVYVYPDTKIQVTIHKINISIVESNVGILYYFLYTTPWRFGERESCLPEDEVFSTKEELETYLYNQELNEY